MIHLCTCTGGSASTNNTSSTRRGGSVSCKNCGGRPAINGKNSSSCLLSTVLELTSLINSDFTWTKVSKGCRSSSRRPRTSNTINLSCGELLTNDSNALEMPVSESEKLGVSVLGCHFSEKAEHIPIKKRRFLFRASSPPHNISLPLEGPTSPRNIPNLAPVLGTCQKDEKLDDKKLVKGNQHVEDEDFSGISILAAAACSNSLGAEPDSGILFSVTKNPEESKEKIVKSANICKEESDSHISRTPSKDLPSLDESEIQKSSRLSWDLNTVMDAWEEPFVSEHEASAHDNVQKKIDEDSADNNVQKINDEISADENVQKKKDEDCEVKSENTSKEMSNPNELHLGTAETSELGNGIFSKWAGQNSEAVDTHLSMDCSVPPGFDHCLNSRPSREIIGISSESEFKKEIIGVSSESEFKKEIIGVSSESEFKKHDLSLATASSSFHEEAKMKTENGFGFDNPRAEKQDEISIGYDSQYEDGELRESSIKGEKGAGMIDVHETISECVQEEGSSGIKETQNLESGKEADLIPENFHGSDEVSGSEPNEMMTINGQDILQKTTQSDEWKMNVSGLDLENPRISSNNFTKNRNFSRKFSYGETEDLDMKGEESSRFYRKGRDVFLSRGRFRMQGCSSKSGDGLSLRQERESGAMRSFGRGRYSPPHNRGSGRGGGVWNRSPERCRDIKRLPSPTYEVGPMDNNIMRSRSPMNREANDFRARLGLRPTGDDRFINMNRGRGRGRAVRYGSRLDGDGPGPGPRTRYNDECDEFLPEYSHPFPRRRRCFSPVERQANYGGGSRSRTRSPVNIGFRRRSRSPPPPPRIRRPRSPNYRRGFEPDNSSPPPPPGSRWVNYRRSSPPPPGRTDSFYESSRKPKPNEFYRSGRFSDVNEGGRGRRYEADRPNNGYRRGGFVRRYNVDDDGFGRGFDARDKHALEVHARGNSSNNNNGMTVPVPDGRFRDFARRSREDGGEFKRRSREGKGSDSVSEEKQLQIVKDQSNLELIATNQVAKEDEKPILGTTN